MAHLHSINVSSGGVPKLPVDAAEVRRSGISGDTQAKRGIHGGIWKAVSLWSLETIEALAADGHPIAPGAAGENLTLAGLDWSLLAPGTTLAIGHEVILRIASHAVPCRTISACFSDGGFERIHHQRGSHAARLYASVDAEGIVRGGDEVRLVPAAGG